MAESRFDFRLERVAGSHIAQSQFASILACGHRPLLMPYFPPSHPYHTVLFFYAVYDSSAVFNHGPGLQEAASVAQLRWLDNYVRNVFVSEKNFAASKLPSLPVLRDGIANVTTPTGSFNRRRIIAEAEKIGGSRSHDFVTSLIVNRRSAASHKATSNLKHRGESFITGIMPLAIQRSTVRTLI